MELTETIESLNNQLIDLFGIDSISGKAIWRIVFSEDQYEKRYGTYDDISPAGVFIRRVTEVRLVPKYKQWIHGKYILERLVVVPEINMPELPAQRISYEPIWVFQDGHEDYLPPKLEACQFIINTIYAVQYGPKGMKRYYDPETDQEAHLELKRQRIEQIQEELYGDESGLLGTTLNCGSSIIVPEKMKES